MSIENTLAERGARYGKFADHAVISQGIQDVMRNTPRWNDLDQDMKQALSTIADKIARILNGDPYYIDNWHDIIGYAKLVEDRLNMISNEETPLYPKGGTIDPRNILVGEKPSESCVKVVNKPVSDIRGLNVTTAIVDEFDNSLWTRNLFKD